MVAKALILYVLYVVLSTVSAILLLSKHNDVDLPISKFVRYIFVLN